MPRHRRQAPSRQPCERALRTPLPAAARPKASRGCAIPAAGRIARLPRAERPAARGARCLCCFLQGIYSHSHPPLILRQSVASPDSEDYAILLWHFYRNRNAPHVFRNLAGLPGRTASRVDQSLPAPGSASAAAAARSRMLRQCGCSRAPDCGPGEAPVGTKPAMSSPSPSMALVYHNVLYDTLAGVTFRSISSRFFNSFASRKSGYKIARTVL
jgi:hypothetical protein